MASIIDRLSGPSFQDRLNAEDEALQNGDTVLPALQQVQDSQDPELRLRARQLIQRIEQDGLQQSLRAFLAPNSTSELPGWSLVADIVGDTPENRKYYADLLQAEPLLTPGLRRPDRLAGELARASPGVWKRHVWGLVQSSVAHADCGSRDPAAPSIRNSMLPTWSGVMRLA